MKYFRAYSYFICWCYLRILDIKAIRYKKCLWKMKNWFLNCFYLFGSINYTFFFCSISISLQRLHSNEYTCMYKFPFWQNFTVTVTRYCSVFKVCKLKKEIIRCDEKISHCVRQQKVFNIPNISPKIPTYIPSYS